MFEYRDKISLLRTDHLRESSTKRIKDPLIFIITLFIAKSILLYYSELIHFSRSSRRFNMTVTIKLSTYLIQLKTDVRVLKVILDLKLQ